MTWELKTGKLKLAMLAAVVAGFGALFLINELAINWYPPIWTLSDGRSGFYQPDDIRSCMGAGLGRLRLALLDSDRRRRLDPAGAVRICVRHAARPSAASRAARASAADRRNGDARVPSVRECRNQAIRTRARTATRPRRQPRP